MRRTTVSYPWLRVLGASLAAVIGLAARADAADPTAVLSMRLTDLRSNAGRVGCQLFTSEAGFPTNPSAAARSTWCSIAEKGALCSFDPIPAGTYAVACFHDENNNGKVDTNLLGMPTEGVVVSNNAKGFMGPPSFKDAKFVFPGTATELRLKMKYL